MMLNKNDVFVFGSNQSGIHGAGAAKRARDAYQAVLGVGFGLMGNHDKPQSYAIPTKNMFVEDLDIETIAYHVRTFCTFAENHSHLTFWVTDIGCGLAGRNPKEMAGLFSDPPRNAKFSKRFAKIIYENTGIRVQTFEGENL